MVIKYNFDSSEVGIIVYWIGFIFFIYSFFLTVFLNNKNLIMGLYSVLGVFFAYYIANNVDTLSRDYLNYSYWFNEIYQENSFSNIIFGKDPIFQLLVYVIQSVFCNDDFWVYFFIINIIFFLKIKFSSLFSNSLGMVLLMCLIFSQTFILFEITQIRAGLAISIASYVILRSLVLKKNDWLTYFLFLIAVYTHFSTLLMVLVYFIVFFKGIVVNRFFLIYILLFSAFFGLFFNGFVLKIIELNFNNNSRFIDYLNNGDIESISLFSIFFILKIIIIILLLIFWRDLKYLHRVVVFFSGIGCSLQLLLNFNAVFGLRFSELFIFFSLATLIIPLDFERLDTNLRYMYLFFLLSLGFVFYLSSTKILLG